jgi:hypothetical protein
MAVVLTVFGFAFCVSAASAEPLSTIGIVGKCCHEGVPGEYYYANSLDINKKTGDLYLLDPNDSHVLVFDKNGNYKFSFGSEGTGAGQLGKYSSVGISVDQTTGDVYVSESGGPFSNNRISKFSENGEFILTFGRKVDETTLGDVCTKASGDVCQPGSPEGERAIVFTIASVDPSTGNVLVPHGSDETTEVYSPQGKYFESIKTPGVVNQIAIDENETIYVATQNGFKTYTTHGESLGEIEVEAFKEYSPAGMVPGPGTEKPEETHLYVMMTSNVTGKWEVGEFNTAGKLLIEHAIGMPYPTQGAIAVDPSIPHIYVGTYPTDPFGGPAIILGIPTSVPSATTKPVTSLTTNSVTLNGSVNPNGTTLNTFWHFEYRRAGTIAWSKAPANEVNVGNGSSTIEVSQPVSELDPNTIYQYRLVATRELGGGSTTSPIATFKTNYEPPALSKMAPTHITDSEATLQGLIDPRHAQATYHFEYGPTSSYGSVMPLDEQGDGGSQLGRYGVFERISELEPSMEYHFRLVAENAGGKTVGPDLTFTTYSTADEQWPARDIEIVNNPNDGNQGVATFWEAPVSASGEEILWTLPAGAPDSTTGFFQLYLSKRDLASPTGWDSHPIGVPASKQVGGGDNAYIPDAASADFNTFIMHTGSAIITSNFDHTYVRLTRNGEQQVLLDAGNQELESVQMSDDGEYVVFRQPETKELISLHSGVFTKMPTPECDYQLFGGHYKNFATTDLSRIFIQAQGVAAPCEAPGLYMINRESDSIQLIAENATFIRTTPDGSSLLYSKEGDFYRWDEGTNTCLSCGLMPPGVSAGGEVRAAKDFSHIYFTSVHGPEEKSGVGIYVLEGGQVKYLTTMDSNVGIAGTRWWEATPDGKTLVFMSILPTTTADDTGWHGVNEGSEANGYQSAQLYRYSSEFGYVECVSCKGIKGPQGGGLWGGILNGSFTVSDDGSTIAYSTEATLVRGDINRAMDVYEWHNGVIRLITNGEVEFHLTLLSAPRLWGASRDGRVVAFSAGGAKLTGNEQNHFGNAYAAVVGGPGFPPPNPPAHCSEDSCQGPLQPSPPLDFQGSSAFHGPGSPASNIGHGGRKEHHVKKHRHKQKHHHKQKHPKRDSTARHG